MFDVLSKKGGERGGRILGRDRLIDWTNERTNVRGAKYMMTYQLAPSCNAQQTTAIYTGE